LLCDAAALSNFYINAGDAGRLMPEITISAMENPVGASSLQLE
jgi:hypothetical protein